MPLVNEVQETSLHHCLFLPWPHQDTEVHLWLPAEVCTAEMAHQQHHADQSCKVNKSETEDAISTSLSIFYFGGWCIVFFFPNAVLTVSFFPQWLCLSKTDLSCHPQPQNVQHHRWWVSADKCTPQLPVCHVTRYNVCFVLPPVLDPPSSTAGRTLTLVAKSVQNLANLVEFGAKVWIPCI